jgi:CBS domain-containing protein
MTVKSIAREEVVTIAAGASVEEVVETMRKKNVGSVVVMDGDAPVGIVTDRDVAINALGADIDPGTMAVEDVMSGDLVAVESEVGMLDLLSLMGEEGIRRVPVVEDDQLVGIVTLDDILVLLSMELQSIANIIRATSPPYEVSATDLFG